MTLDKYIHCIKLLNSASTSGTDIKNEDDDEIKNWISVIDYLYDIDSKTIGLGLFNKYMEETSADLNIETLETNEMHSFFHNDEYYKVDTTIFTANVALFADFNIKTKRYKGAEQLKQILSLLVYKENEPDDYSIERSQLNLQRLGDLDLKIAIGIVRFFFRLLENYILLSEISLETQQLMKEIQNLQTD